MIFQRECRSCCYCHSLTIYHNFRNRRPLTRANDIRRIQRNMIGSRSYAAQWLVANRPIRHKLKNLYGSNKLSIRPILYGNTQHQQLFGQSVMLLGQTKSSMWWLIYTKRCNLIEPTVTLGWLYMTPTLKSPTTRLISLAVDNWNAATTQLEKCSRRIAQNSKDPSVLAKSQRQMEMFGVLKMLGSLYDPELAIANFETRLQNVNIIPFDAQ